LNGTEADRSQSKSVFTSNGLVVENKRMWGAGQRQILDIYTTHENTTKNIQWFCDYSEKHYRVQKSHILPISDYLHTHIYIYVYI